ncbi:MAG: D-2-hydroxyacid dehydrogenase [Desulfopila sp.]
MNAVFLDAEGLEACRLADLHEVCGELTIFAYTRSEELDERIGGAELLIVNKVRIGRATLAAHPAVKLICLVATGADCIDLVAAREFGVTVCNCRGYGTDSVVQHVFAMILALKTSLVQYHQSVQDGRWQGAEQFCFLDHRITELAGKTMGIVGFGNLGKRVATVAEVFGMDVIVAARPGMSGDSRPPLLKILPDLDVLTLHCPLTEATRHLIGRRELALMKPTALLINAARGGIVDEAALAEALRDGIIGGGGVDVLSEEPPRGGNVLLDAGLANLIVTPHIAWASQEARQRLVDQTVENIVAWQHGRAIRVVGD